LLSLDGKKVLNLERNEYYGGEGASLSLEQLYQHFEGKDAVIPKEYGKSRDWNVDLIPKFIFANGKLVKILRACGITGLDFVLIDGSYVYQKGKIYKVPADLGEVTTSPLMSFLEKFRCKGFLGYVMGYDPKDPKTHLKYDLTKMKMKDLYYEYGLAEETIDFLGHAVACYFDDGYLQQPALEAVMRMKLYYESLSMYGKSPYIYPLYGLGELPQVFARMCAVYGGVQWTRKKVDKLHYDSTGHITGVESEGEVCKINKVVCDPSYAKESEGKLTQTGKIIRCVCILDHAIADTNNSKSCQIIIPQKQSGRKNDIYVCCISDTHYVCTKGKFLAIIATTVETSKPLDELKVAFGLLGKVEKYFVSIVDTFVPKSDGRQDGLFVSRSMDASTHFETTAQEALDLYERITGKKFDLTLSKEARDKLRQDEEKKQIESGKK
jgi:Rab GDP dissociation inhibitor